eukprot:scaffold465_cov383-Pavlova_lutheri.AAC.17
MVGSASFPVRYLTPTFIQLGWQACSWRFVEVADPCSRRFDEMDKPRIPLAYETRRENTHSIILQSWFVYIISYGTRQEPQCSIFF